MAEGKTTSVHDNVLGGLKVLVGALLAVSLSLLIPLVIPIGFAIWVGVQVFHVQRFTGPTWPWTVLSYAYFVFLVTAMGVTKRLWVFLATLAVLVASTWAACYELKDALAMPYN